ncbi:circumsporozoite protein precursor [Ilyonectria robusta]
MSMLKITSLITLLAYAEARFGQEQIPVAAVAALGDAGFGDPGVAATIAGSIPGSLLAAASPCQKLTIADQIITELGTDQQVIDAAIGLVSAETNFNPFAVNVPFVCADATLPASAQLRGIVPLVDPAVTGSDVENANSATSVTTPFDAAGLSQAEQPTQCGGGASNATPTNNAGNGTAADGNNNNNNNDAATGGGAAVGTSNLDFGLCQPTMARVPGLNGRAATEFTFIPQDPLCAQGQQEALNPNIITNRICDQLINVCEASDEAIAACDDAQTQIEALGTRDQSTADTWNALLGFAGADSTKATL